MSLQRPLTPCPSLFSADDMAIMAGWFALAAEHGYDAAVGTCDGGTEWVGISPPGMWNESFWKIIPVPSGGGFVVLDQFGQVCLRYLDIRAALHFVAPLPAEALEPQPISEGRVPAFERNGGQSCQGEEVDGLVRVWAALAGER